MFAVIFLCKKYPKHFPQISEAYFNIFFFLLLSVALVLENVVHPDEICQTPVCTNGCAAWPWMYHLAWNTFQLPRGSQSLLHLLWLPSFFMLVPRVLLPAVPLLPRSGADKQLNWCTSYEWAQTCTWWHLQKNSKDREGFVQVLTCLCKGSKAIFPPCNPIN